MLDFMGEKLFSTEVVSLFILLLIIYSVFKRKGAGTDRGAYRSRRFRTIPKHPKRRQLTVRDLVIKLAMSQTDLVQHDVHYGTLTIPKRSGGKRVLHVPDPATKQLQRKLLQQLIGRLPIHVDVHGFRKGHSIVDNAAAHIGQEVIVKLDIVDFFPSTNSIRVESGFQGAGFDKSAAKLLTGLTCYEGGLPQGAPTSPALSNYVNKNMDEKLKDAALRRGANYTRYADDITFSCAEYSRDNIHNLLISTGKILQYYGYRLNDKKKRIIRQHRQQLVTGLVVNERVNLPRKTRRWLRAVKHRLETGGEATLSMAEFRGWLSLLKMVDADSPLLTFLDDLQTREERIGKSLRKNTDVNGGIVRQSSEVETVANAVHQSDSVLENDAVRETVPHQTQGDFGVCTPPNDVMGEMTLSLVEMVAALRQTDKYSEDRKEAEARLAGVEYSINISATSVGRTFSFSLPEGYRDGQTLKATLCNEGLALELYFDVQLGSKIAALDFPMEFPVVVRIVQWNSIFKRIEAVVLRATL